MNIARRTLAGVAFLSALSACTDYPREVAPYGNPYAFLRPPDKEVSAPSDRVTWHGDVRPLVETHCTRCHHEGGVGPMPLDTYEATDGFRDAMVSYVEGGEMPPWPFDESCRELAVARALSDDDKDAFRDWRAGGYRPGAESEYVAPPAPTGFTPSGEVEVHLGRAAWTPTGDGARCFLLAQKVAQNASLDARGWWITDVRIDPDRADLVQQATLYLIAPGDVDLPVEGDAGYDCAFGAGTPGEVALAAWVPGARPVSLPEASALLVPFGARFVLRVQYRTDHLGSLPADATGATLWRYDGKRTPLATQVRAHAISAGAEPVTVHLPSSQAIFALTPELSAGGAALSFNYLGAASPTCTARSARWDAGWAETLQLATPIAALLDNATTLSCSFDDGTSAPRCRVHILATAPLFDDIEPLGATCSGVDKCVDACAGTTTCLLDCLAWEIPACGDCALAQIFSEGCAGQVLRTCEAAQCPTRSDYAVWLGCMLDHCRAELGIMQESFTSALTSGACNREGETCLYFE